MKDLKLKENEVVHCKTEKQAKKVLKIANKLGLTWYSGKSLLENNYWDNNKENTCYSFINNRYSACSGLGFHKTEGSYIITSKEFLKRHKKDKTDKLEDRFVDYSKQVKEVLEGFKDLIVGQRKDIDNLIKQQSIILESDFKEVEPCKEGVIKGPILHVTEIPKVGDVVKTWDEDESKFVYGVFCKYYENSNYPYYVGETKFKNIEKVTEININDFNK